MVVVRWCLKLADDEAGAVWCAGDCWRNQRCWGVGVREMGAVVAVVAVRRRRR